jgi:hypothetical protein
MLTMMSDKTIVLKVVRTQDPQHRHQQFYRFQDEVIRQMTRLVDRQIPRFCHWSSISFCGRVTLLSALHQ